uniref:Inositol 1,4,5-trisphosphate receptor, type 2 n=1 Tax=Petromyzon marinus TaxID=7757 RepID=S4RRE5_PETMA
QHSFYRRLTEDKKSEKFFRVFYERMKAAQQEIKATVTVNTAELGGESKEDDGAEKDLPSVSHSTAGGSGATASGFGEGGGGERATYVESDEISPLISIMEPILRFLQLLCENHNPALQNFLRCQNNKTNYNLVCETLQFLDCICGSTTGGLGLLGLYINERNVGLINQTLESLTEYCQGPCHENQNCIATHESNGIDIIIALILNDINPLGKDRMELVLELKDNASKLLLAIMESRHDSENAERILYNMRPKELVAVIKKAYHQEGEESEDGVVEEQSTSPKEVGHNIYILAHQVGTGEVNSARHLSETLTGLKDMSSPSLAAQLARHNKELDQMLHLSSSQGEEGSEALDYYTKHTSQIEIVRHDRVMEEIVFPVPNVCEFLTSQSKTRVYLTTERDDQGSKISDFFQSSHELFSEMVWQKQLRGRALLFLAVALPVVWGTISSNLTVFMNLLVAFFYPFNSSSGGGTLPLRLSGLLWLAVLVVLALVVLLPRPHSVRALVVVVILRLIFSVGCQPILILLGTANVLNKVVFLVSFVGNKGTFTHGYQAMVMDVEFLFHLSYLIICALGLVMHEFFYSLLLFDLVYREETLLNVIKSVTRNGRSIVLTAVLALILVYLFSIVGFLFLKDDFVMEVDRLPALTVHSRGTRHSAISPRPFAHGFSTVSSWTRVERMNCLFCPLPHYLQRATSVTQTARTVRTQPETISTVICCTGVTSNTTHQIRCLHQPGGQEPLFVARVIYDLLFFFIVIIIVLNLIFGVIIDTFADLRSEKQKKEEVLKTTCFICAAGLERDKFDNKTVSFEEHIKVEHNMWNYLYFIVLIKVKDPTEYTGPESYVAQMIREENVDWFPRMRAMSLVSSEGEGEQNEMRVLQEKLEMTARLISGLCSQLSELKEQV